ncbi:MAG: hypothetical protein ACJ8ER_00470 [Allosphingosinicella sp.]
MKSRLFRSSACILGLLLVAACDGQGAASADTTSNFTTAADALSVRLKAGVPPVKDSAVAGFESEASRGLQTLGTPALPLRGFDSYDDLCGKTAQIAGAYINAGAEGAPEASRAEIMNRNATQYIDQLFTPLLFSAHCSAAHMPFLEKETGSDVVASKAAALQQVRAGAYGQVAGLLQMAAASDLDEARRKRIVELLAADAPNFAIIFSNAQRQELSNGAESVRANLPDAAKGDVDRIKAGLSSTPCGPLCKM